jgi:hypothetical protein
MAKMGFHKDLHPTSQPLALALAFQVEAEEGVRLEPLV